MIKGRILVDLSRIEQRQRSLKLVATTSHLMNGETQVGFKVLELCGPVIDEMSIEGRQTICGQAMFLVVFASVWKQISYNFLFFVAGLQAIPKSLLEAAGIDGASRHHAFWTIVFPLLAPTTFFLLVVNTVYALFDTFGIIHAVTGGGPGKATETLVYKVYNDGFVNLDLGSSAAQSVILMIIVIALTAFQFRFVEKRVHYA